MDKDGHFKDYAAAINYMQQLSIKGVAFKIEFRKADGQRRVIHNARLRKQSIAAKDQKSKYKIQLTDLSNEQPRSCFIPLIIAVNDIKIKL